MQHPTLPEDMAVLVPTYGIGPGERVLSRLRNRAIPIHLRAYMSTASAEQIVGVHSAGVQIDSGDYQGRHRATESSLTTMVGPHMVRYNVKGLAA